MIRYSKPVVMALMVFVLSGCGGGSDEPKLKAVEPPDTPVKNSDAPKGDRFKGSSGAMNKNPGADS